MVRASNDLLYVGELPIFYWPVLATDLNEPSFYLRRIRFKQDKVFGTQVLTNWNMFQLLGVQSPPKGVDWDLGIDYLSKRGFGHGMSLLYHRDDFFGMPAPMAGMADYWGIYDHGFDNLGIDRSHVRTRGQLSLSFPVAASPATARGLQADRRSRQDQRPQFPRRILQEGMGRAEGPDDRRRIATDLREPLAEHPGPGPLGQLLHRDPVVAACRSLLVGRIALGQPAHVVRAHQRGLCPVPHVDVAPTRPRATRP